MVSWRQRLRDSEERNLILFQENQSLKERVCALEKRLLAYENAHTPPSLKQKKKKPPKTEKPKKLGAPKGHTKWERKEPEPTGSVEYSEDNCPHCKTPLGHPIKTERIIEEEIPQPQPIEVIEHLVNHYCCDRCGKHIVAKKNAPKTRFGKNKSTYYFAEI